MKIFGFDIDVDSDMMEFNFREAIYDVMSNARIDVDSGVGLVGQLIDKQISRGQLTAYLLSRDDDEDVSGERLFLHLDKWQEKMGAFSTEDMLYLHSQEETKYYQAELQDIQSLVKYISSRVIGQDAAIKSIVTAAWMHCTSVRNGLGINIPAQLLVGNTGVGKTQILNLLSEALSVPVVNVFASLITAPGYKGGDSLVEQVFSQYSAMAIDGSSSRQPVLVIIHEIDKAVNAGKQNAYNHELMASIMSLIERTTIHKANMIGGGQSIDMKNILVIFDGCFAGIEHIVSKRIGGCSVGFGSHGSTTDCRNLRSKVTKADLVAYGMLPELISRMSNPICLNDMSYNLMCDILKHSVDSPVSTYIKAFQQFDVKLRFSEGAIKTIASLASENGQFGARSLEAVVSEVMIPYAQLLNDQCRKTILIGKREVCRAMSNMSL